MVKFEFTLTDGQAEALANILQNDITHLMTYKNMAMVDGKQEDVLAYDAIIEHSKHIKKIIMESSKQVEANDADSIGN